MAVAYADVCDYDLRAKNAARRAVLSNSTTKEKFLQMVRSRRDHQTYACSCSDSYRRPILPTPLHRVWSLLIYVLTQKDRQDCDVRGMLGWCMMMGPLGTLSQTS